MTYAESIHRIANHPKLKNPQALYNQTVYIDAVEKVLKAVKLFDDEYNRWMKSKGK